MECPICKNRIGFNCGTCIDCGYNFSDDSFKFIRVDTEILQYIISPHILNELIDEHLKSYKRFNRS